MCAYEACKFAHDPDMAMEQCFQCSKEIHRQCAQEVTNEPLDNDVSICSERCFQKYIGVWAATSDDTSNDDKVSVFCSVRVF